MARYEVIDPTGQNFWQVIDTIGRTGPFSKRILNDDGIEVELQVYKGYTWVVASFTPYMPRPEREARELADRLNADPMPVPAQARTDAGFVRYPGDIMK